LPLLPLGVSPANRGFASVGAPSCGFASSAQVSFERTRGVAIAQCSRHVSKVPATDSCTAADGRIIRSPRRRGPSSVAGISMQSAFVGRCIPDLDCYRPDPPFLGGTCAPLRTASFHGTRLLRRKRFSDEAEVSASNQCGQARPDGPLGTVNRPLSVGDSRALSVSNPARKIDRNASPGSRSAARVCTTAAPRRL
jgi:hypothetical protein